MRLAKNQIVPCSLLVALGWLAGNSTSSSVGEEVVVRDARGATRVRLGVVDVAKDSYGLEMFSPDGKLIASLKSGAEGAVVSLGLGAQVGLTLSSEQDKAYLVVGDPKSVHVRMEAEEGSGVRLTGMRGGDQAGFVCSVAAEGGASSITLLDPGRESAGAPNKVSMAVDMDGAEVSMSRGGADRVYLGTVKDEGAMLMLGGKERGAALRVMEDGASMMTLYNEAKVNIENGPRGAGLVIGRSDGSIAVRATLQPDDTTLFGKEGK